MEAIEAPGVKISATPLSFKVAMSFGGLEGSWLPVILLAAIVLGGLIWWRFWYLRDPTRAGGALPDWLGPWPVDPRRIATREDLVLAFEYQSVLTCGREARTWTHGTIARALADLAATHLETARQLARASLQEARRSVWAALCCIG